MSALEDIRMAMDAVGTGDADRALRHLRDAEGAVREAARLLRGHRGGTEDCGYEVWRALRAFEAAPDVPDALRRDAEQVALRLHLL
jgi:hypothetical protein